MKKIPMRTCVVTKEKTEKNNLVRVVRTPEGNVIIDLSGKANGKGAYLIKDLSVIEKAKKSKALDRALDVIVPDNIYEELTELVNK